MTPQEIKDAIASGAKLELASSSEFDIYGMLIWYDENETVEFAKLLKAAGLINYLKSIQGDGSYDNP